MTCRRRARPWASWDGPVLSWIRDESLIRDVVLVGAIAFGLGLIRIGTPSFWLDEGFSWSGLQRSYTFYLEGFYWLFYTVMKPWAMVMGTSEWALRLPSVFAAMGSAALVVVIGRRLFDPRVGLVAGLLLATSPFVVRWSQQARSYTMGLTLGLLATLLLLRALERPTRRRWGVYGLAVAIVIVWQPVTRSPDDRTPRRARRPPTRPLPPHGLLAVWLVLLLGVPWAAQLWLRSRGSDSLSWIEFPTFDVAVGAVLDVSGATGLGVFLALLGVWILRRANRGATAAWLAVWAFSPFVLSFLVSFVQPYYVDRYMIIAAPAFALLAAVALVKASGRQRPVLVAAVVVMTALGLGEWYSLSEGGNWRGEDWRSAVALTRDRGAAEIIVAPGWASRPAEYYGAEVVETSSRDSVWVLTWSEDDHDLQDAERQPLGIRDHVLRERHQFGWRVSAQLWERPRSR